MIPIPRDLALLMLGLAKLRLYVCYGHQPYRLTLLAVS